MKWRNFERVCLSLVTLFFISFNLFAEENSIILTMRDGRVNAVALLDEPKLTFPQDSLQIETEDFNLIVSRQDFSFYSFGDFESTLIKEKSVDNSFVYLDGDILVVKGRLASSLFSITDVEGRVFPLSQMKESEEQIEISLKGVPAGVYCMVLGDMVFKFVRR